MVVIRFGGLRKKAGEDKLTNIKKHYGSVSQVFVKLIHSWAAVALCTTRIKPLQLQVWLLFPFRSHTQNSMWDDASLCTLPGECLRFSLGLTHLTRFTCLLWFSWWRRNSFPCFFFFFLVVQTGLIEGFSVKKCSCVIENISLPTNPLMQTQMHSS